MKSMERIARELLVIAVVLGVVAAALIVIAIEGL